MNQFQYGVQELGDGITRITGFYGEHFYLVCGKERAALVDTGIGVGRLDRLVGELTPLPVDILLTHGHCDHANGAFYFDQVFIHPADIELMHVGMEVEQLQAPDVAARLEADGFDPRKRMSYHPILAGDRFDLGGRVLEAVALPGHTRGSLAFLDRERRTLFTGDACNKRTFLFLPESTCVVEYMATLQALIRLLPEVDRVYNAHDEGEIPAQCPHNVMACCVEVLNGSDEKLPFVLPGGEGFCAHELVGVDRRDGVYGNLLYSPGRIYPAG